MAGIRGWACPSLTSVCTLLMVFLLCLSPAQSLYCAQCQHVDPACRYGHIGVTQCADANATHCYIIRLYVGIGYGTFRGCINKSDENNDECRRTTVNGQEGVACMEACDWNGCNSAIGSPRPWE